MTVAELLSRISSRELTEWMALDAIEPVGDRRLDVLAAIQMALIANINRDRKKRKKPYSAEDFMPQWDKPETAEGNGARMLSVVEMLNMAFNGEDKRQK